jgi:MFS family permease
MGSAATKDAEEGIAPIGFADVLRIRAFAVLYAAEMQSIAGDQLARVALSVLVFDETGSALATAATYAATLLPAIFGGVLLSRIGDRLPRRAVMVGCDVLRAACFAAMASSAIPIGWVIALLVLAVFVGPAFSASEVSYLAVRLESEQFRVATALRLMTSQAAQVGGFALGGVLVAALDPHGALLVDAATYAVSAVLIGVFLGGAGNATGSESPDPASAGSARPAAHLDAGRFDGLWGDRRVRALVALSTLAGFFVVPEGLAVPFGSSVGASTRVIGLLLAAGALGGALGAALLVRFVRPDHRERVANWMAVGCGLPLVLSGLVPHWPLALACWLMSGLLAAYIIEVMTIVVQTIPDAHRSHLVGIVGALLTSAQGLGLVLFGALTQVVSPAHAIALAGLAGCGCALLLVLGPLRRRPDYPASHRRDSRGPEGPDASAMAHLHVRDSG